MRTQLRYVLPDVVDASILESQLGKVYECPYCQSQNTAMRDESDTGWIQLDYRRSRSNWVCMGCCIDIFSTVTDDEFESNPYRSVVEEAAMSENMTVDEYRAQALRFQMAEIEKRDGWNLDSRLSELHKLIESLVSKLDDV